MERHPPKQVYRLLIHYLQVILASQVASQIASIKSSKVGGGTWSTSPC